ncbi:MAG: peptidylprolyl isomerase [Muribaculaceae bacterium]|nr:peptidylprolyl isomerase [Muribaculaceae bacterium]
MKTAKILFSALLLLAVVAGAMAASDPVLMKINGQKVKLSEFEYMYHKNSDQQVQPLTLDEYVDMFVNYKLKVLAAEEAGIDTTASFRKEFAGYRADLAKPYLRDQSVEDDLLQKAYQQAAEEVHVAHIMLNLAPNSEGEKESYARLDSIRNEVINNGQSFEALCEKFSIDNGSKRNGGDQGFIDGQRGLPYTFVDAAFSTPVGEISKPFTTPYGYHIVRVIERRPSRGQVQARHIFKKLMNEYTPEEEARTVAVMDSLYNVLQSGSVSFEEVAMKNSEDGTARNGGMLGWFAPAQMIPEFSDVVFAMKNGEISKPFKTRFGYHIAQRLNWKGVGTFDELKPQLLNAIRGDERSNKAELARLEQLKSVYKPAVQRSAMKKLHEALVANGGLDSVVTSDPKVRSLVAGKVGSKKVTLGEVFDKMPVSAKINADEASRLIEGYVNRSLDRCTLECEMDHVEATNADFRNLVNEYRDGILMFDISNRNVWEKASQDKAGLEDFFKNNRSNYSWPEAKYKGYVVYATSDSVLTEVKGYLAQNPVKGEEMAKALRAKFAKEVKVEKVVAAKGESPVVDNIAFGGAAPDEKGRWKFFFSPEGKLIAAPEEAADVRGPVTTDYQNYLEQQWVKSLRDKYKVEVDQKVLKMVK